MPGPWNFDNAPMALEPMQICSDRNVRVITVWTPAQLLKSEFCINVALWSAYYNRDVLLFEPDQKLGEEFMRERIRPAMMSFGGVQIIDPGKRGPKKVDSVGAIRYPGGGLITALTPGMRTGKSGRAAPVIIHDEIDKMGDPSMSVSAVSRATTFGGDALVVNASTATVDAPGTIVRIWSEGSMGVWHGRCIQCEQLVGVGWDRVFFEKDSAGLWLPETMRMTCENCGHAWSESERQQTVRAGQYIHKRPHIVDKRSFHVPGAAHIFNSIRDIVDEGAGLWRNALEEEDWESYQLFCNERLGIAWDPDIEGLSARKMERSVYSLGSVKRKHHRGMLDPRVVFVTAGADIGSTEMFIEFVAWGIDYRTGDVMCWGLEFVHIGGAQEDSIDDPALWEQFSEVVDNYAWEHPYGGGVMLPAERVVVDCGYRPEVVRAYCKGKYMEQLRQSGERMVAFGGRILPIRSRSREAGEHPVDMSTGIAKCKRSRFEDVPATLLINSNAIKDMYYTSLLRDRRMAEGVEKNNLWPVDGEARGYTAGYFAEMANERRYITRTKTGMIKTHWTVKSGKAKRNDAFDCRVYAMAAALFIVFPHTFQFGILERAVEEWNNTASHLTSDQWDSIVRLANRITDEGWSDSYA